MVVHDFSLKFLCRPKWTTLPTDTEELIKIQSYIMDIKGKRLQEIDIELEEMLKRMMYLLGKFRNLRSETLDFENFNLVLNFTELGP